MPRFKNADVAVAVSYEGGLITPIVHGANQLGLNQIAATTKDLIDRARKSQLQPHEFSVKRRWFWY
jgi:pyruvate dehydrogenase E2 component (dihydrolipoamide acetyltransferase)